MSTHLFRFMSSFGSVALRRAFGVAVASATMAAWTSPASADAGSCTTLHATAQRDMKAGQLRSASKQFMACGSDETCPEAVRTDCMQLFETAERLTPTVIFSVVDEQGADMSMGVKVFSGEELLVENLDGRAIPLNPGRYQLRFVMPWSEIVGSDVMIREGEKNRVVSIKVVDPNKKVDPAATSAAPPAPESLPPVIEPVDRTPTGFWVATGVGAAALATGVVFEVMGYSTHSDLADCSPRCDASRSDDYDAMKRNYLIGDIAIGAGLVSFGVAALIYFNAGSSSAEANAAVSRIPLTVAPRRDGASVFFTGTTF